MAAGGKPKTDRTISEDAKEDVDEKWYSSYMPNSVAGGSTQPLIPIFLSEGLGGNVAQFGMISAASSVASVPSSVFWGDLSDRLKKRKLFVVLGFIGTGFSFLLMGLAQDVIQYLVANIIMGLLATANATIGVVLITETAKERKWAEKIGKFSKIGGWGWVFGLCIGTVWLFIPFGSGEAAAMRILFTVSAILSFCSAYLAYAWIDEPRQKHPRMQADRLVGISLRPHERSHFLPAMLLHLPKLSSFKKLRLHGLSLGHSLTSYLAVAFLMAAAFAIFYTVFPIFMITRIGIPAGQVFIIYLSSSVASALMYVRAGHLIDRVGAKNVQLLSVSARVLLIPSFISILLFQANGLITFALLLALHALMGICWAMIAVSGTVLVSELAPPQAKGESIGVYTAVQGVATITGALAGGWVAFAFGYVTTLILPSVLLVGAVVLLLRIRLITKEVDKGAGHSV